jgi:hypothetical protein
VLKLKSGRTESLVKNYPISHRCAFRKLAEAERRLNLKRFRSTKVICILMMLNIFDCSRLVRKPADP